MSVSKDGSRNGKMKRKPYGKEGWTGLRFKHRYFLLIRSGVTRERDTGSMY